MAGPFVRDVVPAPSRSMIHTRAHTLPSRVGGLVVLRRTSTMCLVFVAFRVVEVGLEVPNNGSDSHASMFSGLKERSFWGCCRWAFRGTEDAARREDWRSGSGEASQTGAALPTNRTPISQHAPGHPPYQNLEKGASPVVGTTVRQRPTLCQAGASPFPAQHQREQKTRAPVIMDNAPTLLPCDAMA